MELRTAQCVLDAVKKVAAVPRQPSTCLPCLRGAMLLGPTLSCRSLLRTLSCRYLVRISHFFDSCQSFWFFGQPSGASPGDRQRQDVPIPYELIHLCQPLSPRLFSWPAPILEHLSCGLHYPCFPQEGAVVCMGFARSCMKEERVERCWGQCEALFGASSALLRETLRCNKIR